MNTISRLKAIRDSADHIATWTERDGLDRSRLASIANHAEVVAQDYAALLAACKEGRALIYWLVETFTTETPHRVPNAVTKMVAAIALAEGGQA